MSSAGRRRGRRSSAAAACALLLASCAAPPGGADAQTTSRSSAVTVATAPVTVPALPHPASSPPSTVTSGSASTASATASSDLTSDLPAEPVAGPPVPTAPSPPATTVITPRPDPDCPGVRCVTVVLTGDVLIHPELVEQARQDATPGSATTRDGLDFFPMLSAQQPWVAGADAAICHLETPLAPADGPFEGWPNFSAPPQVLPALTAVGYDACTTASNHTLDQGVRGAVRTLDDLDAAGLRHAGSARTADEAQAPVILDTPGGRVGLVAATYDLNGNEPDTAWRVQLLDADAILTRARAARAAGADLVVVALHAGREYDREPNGDQEFLASTLLADPAVDLVYGHHAHVVQPIQRIDGKWAVFGLGNGIAAQRTSADGVQDGLLVRVRFSQDASGGWTTAQVGWLPGHIDDGPPYRWCPADGTPSCRPADPAAAAQGAADTTAIIESRGAAQDGAVRLSATG